MNLKEPSPWPRPHAAGPARLAAVGFSDWLPAELARLWVEEDRIMGIAKVNFLLEAAPEESGVDSFRGVTGGVEAGELLKLAVVLPPATSTLIEVFTITRGGVTVVAHGSVSEAWESSRKPNKPSSAMSLNISLSKGFVNRDLEGSAAGPNDLAGKTFMHV